jgi:HSP20 family protein
MMFLTELRPLTARPTTARPQRAQGFRPAVSLIEDAEGYTISVELPGVRPESIEVTLLNDELTIKGQKALPALPEGAAYHANERLAGAFERTVKFPMAVAQDGITARTALGILTVHVAKAVEALPRTIQVTAG